MNIKNFLKQVFYPQDSKDYDFTLPETTNPRQNLEIDDEKVKTNYDSQSVDENIYKNTQEIFPSVDVNYEYIKVKYNTLINSDIVTRKFILNIRNKQYKAFILYIDGMVNTTTINDFILKPLMLKNSSNSFDGEQNRVVSEAISNNITVRRIKKFDISEYVSNCLIPQNNVTECKDFQKAISGTNSGDCILFIDTLNIAFDIEVKGFEKRSLGEPNNEIVVRGAQVAFTETIRTNTSLLRRFVNNENLIIENVDVGKISKTKCAICYIKNIANSDLVAEVKYRINNLNIDYLISSGKLEQLIEDKNSTLPQLIATERPDKATNYLIEGRVVIIVNGSPYVLIAPAVFTDFLNSPEDLNLKYQFSNLLKFIRIIAFILTLLLPGIYIAITNFHQEFIPTELLFAIVASREAVPFPIIFEIFLMEFSFELIREAGLRVPSPIGPTVRNCWCSNFRTSSSGSNNC